MPPILDNLCDGKGEMKALIRAFPWRQHPLGPPDTWPRALLAMAELVLNSHFPMFLAWGPQLELLYNDAYIPILQHRHPQALMRPMREVWGEAWDRIDGIVERTLAGQSSFFEDFHVEIERNGRPAPGWFTLAYNPVRDDTGQVAGLLCMIQETTARVQAEAQQAFRLHLAESLRSLADPDEIAATAARLLGEHLHAARVLYVDIDTAHNRIDANRDWTDGRVASLAGQRFRLDDFLPPALLDPAAPRSWSVNDVRTDPRAAERAAHHEARSVRALIHVSIVKEGRLIAALRVHADAPREWSAADVELAQIVADYAWPALERSRAEQALRSRSAAEASRLRELFRAAPSPILVLQGREMIVEMTNDAYDAFIGRRDVVGRSLYDAVPETMAQGYDVLLEQVFDTGQPYVGRGMRFDLVRGGVTAALYHDALYQPLRDADGKVGGIFVLAYDVTEMHQAQQALRDSEERLRQGMEAARMVVWDMDLQSQRVECSANALEVIGYRVLEEGDLYRHVHPDDVARARARRVQASPAQPHYSNELRVIRPDDGSVVWLETRGQVLFDEHGQAVRVKGVSIDVTARKTVEQRLLEANRQKDEFLAMLGHELRNPLAPIRAAADLMTLGRLDEARLRTTSRIIARQVDHMTALVDDLLDVSRVTRGLVVLEKKTVDLKHIVAHAVEQVGPLIEARRHHLSLHLTPRQAHTFGDEKRLVQIVANVLNNAAKYTPEGGRIDLALDIDDGFVRLVVHDNGIGIAPALQPHVFDLFRQAARTPDRTQGGLGLGLALVKSLMELHGGRIGVASEGEGRGSSFTLLFPHTVKDAGADDDMHGPARLSGRPRRILLVDDNQDAAGILALLLESSGHAVVVAHDARQALAATVDGSFDACLLDIGLPDIDGHELARRLRALPATAAALLVAVTGYGQASDRQRACDAGFDEHLVKPVDLNRLLAVLEQAERRAA